MARLARIVVPGLPHHITQRGNRRMEAFFAREDREAYLKLLRKYLDRHGLQVWAYCLMPNHVHPGAVPLTEAVLSRTPRNTHSAYASHLNRQEGASGHLWQGRFFSSVLDEAHLWVAVRYVERSPVRAGLAGEAAAYPCGSARAHVQGAPDPVLGGEFPPPGMIEDWAEWLQGDDELQSAHLRQQTHTGRPRGGHVFLEALERLLARRVQPQRRGRKPKHRLADLNEQSVHEQARDRREPVAHRCDGFAGTWCMKRGLCRTARDRAGPGT